MMWIASIPLWLLASVFLLLGVCSTALIFDDRRRKDSGDPIPVLIVITVFMALSASSASIAIWMVR